MACCREKNARGEPCRAPASLVDPVSGFCPAHGPGAKERLSEQGKVGAQVTKQVRRKGKGLRPGELGPLRTPEDAKRWLRIIGRAVAEGRPVPPMPRGAQGGQKRIVAVEPERVPRRDVNSRVRRMTGAWLGFAKW
jgi:hypothetical protein